MTTSDLLVQISLYQQIVQLASSILFFTIAFLCVKYYMIQRAVFARDEDNDTAKSSEEFKFHVDSRMHRFYSTQSLMLKVTFIRFLMPCFF